MPPGWPEISSAVEFLSFSSLSLLAPVLLHLSLNHRCPLAVAGYLMGAAAVGLHLVEALLHRPEFHVYALSLMADRPWSRNLGVSGSSGRVQDLRPAKPCPAGAGDRRCSSSLLARMFTLGWSTGRTLVKRAGSSSCQCASGAVHHSPQSSVRAVGRADQVLRQCRSGRRSSPLRA